MKYLLDTSVFLWALAAPGKLNRRARNLLSNEREGLFLSAASSWEISPKFGLGKLELPEPPVKYVPKWMLNWGIRESRICTPSRSATCRCIIRTHLIAF